LLLTEQAALQVQLLLPFLLVSCRPLLQLRRLLLRLLPPRLRLHVLGRQLRRRLLLLHTGLVREDNLAFAFQPRLRLALTAPSLAPLPGGHVQQHCSAISTRAFCTLFLMSCLAATFTMMLSLLRARLWYFEPTGLVEVHARGKARHPRELREELFLVIVAIEPPSLRRGGDANPRGPARSSSTT
jgi:hypothetical protein